MSCNDTGPSSFCVKDFQSSTARPLDEVDLNSTYSTDVCDQEEPEAGFEVQPSYSTVELVSAYSEQLSDSSFHSSTKLSEADFSAAAPCSSHQNADARAQPS